MIATGCCMKSTFHAMVAVSRQDRQDAKRAKKKSKTHSEEQITSSGMGAPPMILFSNEEHGRGAHAT
jgi:hypothetical protein